MSLEQTIPFIQLTQRAGNQSVQRITKQRHFQEGLVISFKLVKKSITECQIQSARGLHRVLWFALDVIAPMTLLHIFPSHFPQKNELALFLEH